MNIIQASFRCFYRFTGQVAKPKKLTGVFFASVGGIAGAVLYTNSNKITPFANLTETGETKPNPFTYFPEAGDPISQAIAFGTAFNEARKAGTVDVRTTHIPFLAAEVKNNFNALFPKERSVFFKERRVIEQFQSEMDERIRQGNVTYEWWLLFNMRLSILVTPPQHRSHTLALAENENYYNMMTRKEGRELLQEDSWKNHYTTKGVIHRYNLTLMEDKDAFLFPTSVGGGDFDLHQLNRVFGTGVFLIGLSSRPRMADGSLQFPDTYFRHDLLHYHFITSACKGLDREQVVGMRTRFFEKREEAKGQPELVQLVDVVFHYLTHDAPERNVSELTDGFVNKRSFDTWSETLTPIFYQLVRSDFYKDHFPDPAKFDCCYADLSLWSHGLNTLSDWLSGETTDSCALQYRCTKLPSEVVMEPRITLSYQELSTYNEIVKFINQGETFKAQLLISESQGQLKNFLENSGLTKVFSQPKSLFSCFNPEELQSFV